jgi:hypothetical protein
MDRKKELKQQFKETSVEAGGNLSDKEYDQQ